MGTTKEEESGEVDSGNTTVTTKSQSDLAMVKVEPGEPAQGGACGQQNVQERRKEQTKEERIKVLVAHKPNIPMTLEVNSKGVESPSL